MSRRIVPGFDGSDAAITPAQSGWARSGWAQSGGDASAVARVRA